MQGPEFNTVFSSALYNPIINFLELYTFDYVTKRFERYKTKIFLVASRFYVFTSYLVFESYLYLTGM